MRQTVAGLMVIFVLSLGSSSAEESSESDRLFWITGEQARKVARAAEILSDSAPTQELRDAAKKFKDVSFTGILPPKFPYGCRQIDTGSESFSVCQDGLVILADETTAEGEELKALAKVLARDLSTIVAQQGKVKIQLGLAEQDLKEDPEEQQRVHKLEQDLEALAAALQEQQSQLKELANQQELYLEEIAKEQERAAAQVVEAADDLSSKEPDSRAFICVTDAEICAARSTPNWVCAGTLLICLLERVVPFAGGDGE